MVEHMPPLHAWNLLEELGGEARLLAMLLAFYERLARDLMVGFLFAGKDLEYLAKMQASYVQARLGSARVPYQGKAIRPAHAHLPILPGHFDRRRQILQETLKAWQIPAHVQDAWLELEEHLRELVLRTGQEARRKALE